MFFFKIICGFVLLQFFLFQLSRIRPSCDLTIVGQGAVTGEQMLQA